jgi:hypothetical protein
MDDSGIESGKEADVYVVSIYRGRPPGRLVCNALPMAPMTSVSMSSVGESSIPAETSRAPSLHVVEIAIIVAIAVTHFLFGAGPIWRHPWSPNANILWSYAPIPLLVAIALLRGRRLQFSSWAMGTFAVMVAKFVITAFVLVGLWAVTTPPSQIAAPPAPPPQNAEVTPNSAETIVVPAGAAAPAASAAPMELALGPTMPKTLTVPVGVPVTVVSGDGRMHTLAAPSIGLNVPIVAGARRSVVFAQTMKDPIDFACGVHPTESHTQLVVTR